jgi:amidohydrolase
MHDEIVAWRRDLHAHPELGNRETRTAKVVADHLRGLGLKVRTGVAHTGVVGVLEGGQPGPVVALRADMDALPVREDVDVPFASKVTTTYRGTTTHVMHACGHDMHTAILMGVADALAHVREDFPGTVVFVFQPAEEGAPEGERGGAELMVEQGALADPRPEAIFGLHVLPQPVGDVMVRAGGAMAASDELKIVVRGRQTHGAYPWRGVDPITIAAQIVLALQTIPSRQLDATKAPAVVSIGSIHGGIRSIIPDEVELVGTVRTLDPKMREDLHARIESTATKIAESAGATAEVTFDGGYPVTYNDPELTAWLLPTLRRVAGDDRVHERPPTMGAEDFSFYQQQIPGVYFFLGIVPADQDPATAASNHSPKFFADEGALPLGVRALAHAALDFVQSRPATP